MACQSYLCDQPTSENQPHLRVIRWHQRNWLYLHPAKEYSEEVYCDFGFKDTGRELFNLKLLFDRSNREEQSEVIIMSSHSLAPSLPISRWKFSLLFAIHFLYILFWEGGVRSTDSPLVDMYWYSQYLPAWCCIDTVGRNYVLVTAGSERVKATRSRQLKGKSCCSLSTFTVFLHKRFLWCVLFCRSPVTCTE